jgi:hypothetical protein
MSRATQCVLLAVACVVLLAVGIWGNVDGWAWWSLITTQLLIVAVQVGILRSGKVRS